MTTIIIINAWIFTILAMYAFVNVAFWLFAQAFGIVDNYMQNRYWENIETPVIKTENKK
jgi:hypothetical protein